MPLLADDVIEYIENKLAVQTGVEGWHYIPETHTAMSPNADYVLRLDPNTTLKPLNYRKEYIHAEA